MDNKRLLGQYFTIANPFELNVFLQWFKSIDNISDEVLLEPFAGANNIVELVQGITCEEYNKWKCYDIDTSYENRVPEFEVEERDTIKNFPKGYRVVITNPPYLAKNSATRRNMQYEGEPYDDLYKKCLEVMLANCEYIAAIIPESFITANIFHDRLKVAISLTCRMFNDTECPVCLALFSPSNESDGDDFEIYSQDRYIGQYSELRKFLISSTCNMDNWRMNDVAGNIGIVCVDNNEKESIRFCDASEISPEEIKVTSRARTRVSGLPSGIDVNVFIDECNRKIMQYRNATSDVFLTSFKGLRKDGRYRRRLDFNTAKNIMSSVLEEMIVHE